MKKRGMIIGTLIFFLVMDVSSQSLSDLDVESFQQLTEGTQQQPMYNPFSGTVTSLQDATAEELVLTGTVVGDEQVYALVNGNILEIGDRVAGYKVETIEDGHVTLKRLDEIYTLRMGGTF